MVYFYNESIKFFKESGEGEHREESTTEIVVLFYSKCSLWRLFLAGTVNFFIFSILVAWVGHI